MINRLVRKHRASSSFSVLRIISIALVLLFLFSVSTSLFAYDIRAPQITLLTPQDGECVSGTVKITARVQSPRVIDQVLISYDNSFTWEQMSLSRPGSLLTPSIYSFTFDTDELSDGTYTIMVTVVDVSGRTAVDQLHIIVDNTAPDLFLHNFFVNNDSEPTITISGETEFVVSAVDTGSGIASVAYQVDDRPWIEMEPIENTFFYKGLIEKDDVQNSGNHYLNIRAEDDLGFTKHLSYKINTVEVKGEDHNGNNIFPETHKYSGERKTWFNLTEEVISASYELKLSDPERLLSNVLLNGSFSVIGGSTEDFWINVTRSNECDIEVSAVSCSFSPDLPEGAILLNATSVEEGRYLSLKLNGQAFSNHNKYQFQLEVIQPDIEEFFRGEVVVGTDETNSRYSAVEIEVTEEELFANIEYLVDDDAQNDDDGGTNTEGTYLYTLEDNGTGENATSAILIGEGTTVGSLPGPSSANGIWYMIYLINNETIDAYLTGPPDTDFDMYFYDTDGSTELTRAWSDTYPDAFSYTVSADGYYFIHVIPFSGSGSFTLDITIYITEELQFQVRWTDTNTTYWVTATYQGLTSDNHFEIYTDDALSISPTFISEVKAALVQSWAQLVPDLGLPYDEDGDGRIEVLLTDIGDTSGVLGYCMRDDPNDLGLIYWDSDHASMGDIDRFGLSHEFTHRIHYNYDINEPLSGQFIFEGTAMWTGDYVWEGIGGYNIQDFLDSPDVPLADFWISRNDPSYGVSYLFFEWLSENYGASPVDLIATIFESMALYNGSEAVSNATGVAFEILFRNWVIDTYLDNYNPPSVMDIYNFITSTTPSLTDSFTFSSFTAPQESMLDDLNPWACDYIQITPPSSDTGSITIDFDGTDGENFEVIILVNDSGVWYNTTMTLESSTNIGSYIVNNAQYYSEIVVLVTRHNASTGDSVSYSITATPATTTALNVYLDSPSNETVISGDNYLFDAEIVDANPGYVWYKWDNGANSTAYPSPWDFTIDTTVLTDDWHDFWLYANDILGNEIVTRYRFEVDNTAPTTTSSLEGTTGQGGWYVSDVTVTLSATDSVPGSGVAVTAYSLDGTTWITYTGPFTISAEGSTTVNYNSTDNAGNVENTHIITITIDKTAPTTTSSLEGTTGQGGWYVSDVTVTLSATDGVSGSGVTVTVYSLDGTTWIDYTGPITISTEGSTTVYYNSTDNAGHVENTQTTTINIDMATPITTISALDGTLGQGGWYVSDVTVTLSATDSVPGSGVAISAYSFDGTTWNAYTGPFVVTTEGTITISYNSTDNAGNVENTHITTINIDKTAPTTTSSLEGTTGQGGWYVSDVTVTLSATDGISGSGVTVTVYSFDGTTWIDYAGPFTITTEGSTTVYYNSTDNAGHVETTQTTTINIDKTAPTTTISALDGTLGQNDWYVSDVTVTLLATDGVSGSGVTVTAYSLDGITWNTYTGPFVVTTEGIITISYNSTDSAGNVETTQTTTINIDKTAPTTTISALDGTLGQNDWYVSDVTVTLLATDSVPGSGVAVSAYSFDGTTWIAYTGPFTITAEGSTTVYYNSTDNADNVENTHITTITIDKTAPTTTISALDGTLGQNDWYVSDVTVTLSATDSVPGSSVAVTAYSLDGTTWNTYTTPFTISTEGSIIVYYNSTDNAGNVETTSFAVIKIDKLPPTTTIGLTGTLGQNDWYVSDVTVTLSATDVTSDVAVVAYSFDGIIWIPYTASFDVTTEGSTTVYYNSTDNAGNVETTSFTVIKIDKLPPTTTIGLTGTLGQNDWYVSDVTVTLSATDVTSDVAVVAYSFDGIIWIPYTAPFDVTTEGSTTIYYNSTDNAGNVENTQTTTITIDKTAPITTISVEGTLGQGGWYVSDVTVTLLVTDISGVAITAYSLDGITWNTYTAPFDVTTEGSTTIYYNSTDNAGNVENTQTTTITIDKTAPITTVSSLEGTLGQGGWYVSDVTVSLSATDSVPGSGVVVTAYSLDGITWNTYTAPFTISTEGSTIVYYNSTDNAGNVENTQTTTINIDKTTPTTTISVAGTLGQGGWYVSDVTVTLLVTDVSGVAITAYSLDGITWNTYTAPFPIPTEGSTTVYYNSTDNAGNVETTQTTTITIDKTAPTTTISALDGTLGQNGWYVSDVTVSLSTTDSVPGSGVAVTAYSLDGITWIDYTGPFVVTAEGTITISYNATDSAGNVETTQMTTINIDKTAPTTTISVEGTTGQGGWYTSDVTVTLSAIDGIPGSGVSITAYSFDGTTWNTYAVPFTITAEGSTSVYYNSTDDAGNVETTRMTTINIDKSYPALNWDVNNFADDTWWDNQVIIDVDASDPELDMVWYRIYNISSSEYIPGHNNVSLLSPDFTRVIDTSTWSSANIYYRVEIFANDLSGNEAQLIGTNARLFRIDHDSPITTLISNGALGQGGWYTSDVTVSLSATDISDVVETVYSFNGINWNTYTEPVVITTEGFTTIYYTSTDILGHVELTKSESIKIDKTSPETTFDLTGNLGQNGWYVSDVTVTFLATDDTSDVAVTAYSLDGINWIDYIVPFTITTEGIITLRYNSTDNAGNVETTALMTIKIDKTPPDITITIPPSDSEVYTGVIWINGTFDDTISQITSISINDTRFSLVEPLGTGSYGITGTFSFSATVTETGVFGVNVTVWDEAGHTDSETRYVMLINTPPGTNVLVTDPITGVTVTFEQILSNGTTTVSTNTTGPSPPSGFEVNGQYYNITTTASYSGNITLAVPYDETQVSGDETNLKLMHWNETSIAWEDITTWVDTTNNIIYGNVTSLSLFAIIMETPSGGGGGGGGSSGGGSSGGGSSGGGDGGGAKTEKMVLKLLTAFPNAVTQGTKITVKFKLTDSSDNGIEGAIVSLTIGNTSIQCTDLGDGIYTATIDTSNMAQGNYKITISASKGGYETTTNTFNLTIKKPFPMMMLVGAGGIIALIALAGIFVAFRFRFKVSKTEEKKSKKES